MPKENSAKFNSFLITILLGLVGCLYSHKTQSPHKGINPLFYFTFLGNLMALPTACMRVWLFFITYSFGYGFPTLELTYIPFSATW